MLWEVIHSKLTKTYQIWSQERVYKWHTNDLFVDRLVNDSTVCSASVEEEHWIGEHTNANDKEWLNQASSAEASFNCWMSSDIIQSDCLSPQFDKMHRFISIVDLFCSVLFPGIVDWMRFMVWSINGSSFSILFFQFCKNVDIFICCCNTHIVATSV